MTLREALTAAAARLAEHDTMTRAGAVEQILDMECGAAVRLLSPLPEPTPAAKPQPTDIKRST